jgi:hypothetical protein
MKKTVYEIDRINDIEQEVEARPETWNNPGNPVSR